MTSASAYIACWHPRRRSSTVSRDPMVAWQRNLARVFCAQTFPLVLFLLAQHSERERKEYNAPSRSCLVMDAWRRNTLRIDEAGGARRRGGRRAPICIANRWHEDKGRHRTVGSVRRLASVRGDVGRGSDAVALSLHSPVAKPTGEVARVASRVGIDPSPGPASSLG